MTESFLNDRVTLHPGDCLEVIARLEDNSVDSVVTDPPYHLTSIVKRFGAENAAPAKVGKTGAYARASSGFMGKQWDGGDIAFRVETWQAILRVLKPGGHLLAFSGTRTYHRMAVAIDDAGFEVRDMISWLYGSGFPKSHDVSKGIDKAAGVEFSARPASGDGFMGPDGPGGYNVTKNQLSRQGESTDAARQWSGFGTALKPACEPIVLARKPLSESTVAANVLRWSTGALNIDGCRVSPEGNASWASEAECFCSCAALAAASKKTGAPATKESSAISPAAPTMSVGQRQTQDDTATTDIGCSDGLREESTTANLNTVASGNPSTAPFRKDTKSTTKTSDEQTTESRTCNSCGKPITARSTNGSTSAELRSSQRGERPQGPIGRDSEPSANRRYTDSGSTNFAATPGPRGGAPAGRWPANVIHDGSDEVVGAFPDVGAGVGGDHSGNDPGMWAGKQRTTITRHNDAAGSAARFFYTAKADADDRLGSNHPTVKPLDLMQYLVRLVTPPKGLVLDPFAGTGTTGEAAWREGMRAVLIEREAEYQDDIRRRMKHALSGPQERKHTIAKAKHGDKPLDEGLFA